MLKQQSLCTSQKEHTLILIPLETICTARSWHRLRSGVRDKNVRTREGSRKRKSDRPRPRPRPAASGLLPPLRHRFYRRWEASELGHFHLLLFVYRLSRVELLMSIFTAAMNTSQGWHVGMRCIMQYVRITCNGISYVQLKSAICDRHGVGRPDKRSGVCLFLGGEKCAQGL